MKIIPNIFLILLTVSLLLSFPSPAQAEDLTQIPVTSYRKMKLSDFNKTFLKAQKNNESWVKDPLQVALIFAGSFEGKTQSITRTNNNPEDPTKTEIIIIDDGYLGDSIRGAWYRLVLKVNAKRIWQLKSAEFSIRCWQKRGQQNFAKENCR